MDRSQYFLLPDGRLRAGWRLLLFVVFFLMLVMVFDSVAFAFLRQLAGASQMTVLAVRSVSHLATVSAATWLMLHLIEHQPFQAVGLARPRESLGEVALGMAGGITLVGTVTVVEWAVGSIHFQSSGTSAASTLISLPVITGVMALAITWEELAFRGYPFQRLVEGTNPVIAVLISSLIFGGLHAANPYATLLSTVNTMLAGVLLSIAYLKTRALWLPLGFHFSWNWTLAFVGLPVSGMEVIKMPWQAVPSPDHIWLHGGSYGPEGGLVATVVLVAGCIYLIQKK